MNRRGFLGALAAFVTVPAAVVRLAKRGPVELVTNKDMRIPLQLRPSGKFGRFDPEGGSLGPGRSYDYVIVDMDYTDKVVTIAKR